MVQMRGVDGSFEGGGGFPGGGRGRGEGRNVRWNGKVLTKFWDMEGVAPLCAL